MIRPSHNAPSAPRPLLPLCIACHCWLLLGVVAAPAAQPPQGLSIVDYRDWSGCYRLDNGKAAAVIVPTSGARLAEFSLNGRNILFEDASANGLDIEAGVRVGAVEWFQWDGCQTDVWKEGVGHQLDQLWLSPFRAIETGPRRAVFQGPVSARHKAQVTKALELHDRNAALRFNYRLTSFNPEPARWACYYRAVCQAPGLVILPLKRTGSAFSDGYEFTADEAMRERREDIARESVRSVDGHLVIAPHRLRAYEHGEIGADPDAGWIAATRGNLLLLIRYQVLPQQDYFDRHTLGVRWQTDRAELQPRGPYVRLAANESTSCDSVWVLDVLPQSVDEFEQAPIAIQRIQALLKLDPWTSAQANAEGGRQ